MRSVSSVVKSELVVVIYMFFAAIMPVIQSKIGPTSVCSVSSVVKFELVLALSSFFAAIMPVIQSKTGPTPCAPLPLCAL